MPNFDLEKAAYASGRLRIVGVDEVGRGPLAGPVIAAAVWLDPQNIPNGLDDSKKLTPKKRGLLNTALMSCADIGIGQASVAEIDQINILRASHLAMERAIAALSHPPDYVLIDGNLIPRGLTIASQAVIKGDSKSLSIAAASIIAKQYRDKLMVDLAQQHPGYGWEKNAGYPTKAHLEALQNLGVTPVHRRSFKPVHNILYQEKSASH
ncbi:ribonuclease HII [Parasulfitobacter algicola]|uniref:Ribonuclease HII n=1 Tax=Parasulfitobacter algicola TaxID=2614809 RepID=A0ABX2IU81_9RHOB|nr:ribonuclease HII [Sulfitobacter algicola]NSX53743.1 ribonuclease HII [Sulfitobacter algicola]